MSTKKVYKKGEKVEVEGDPNDIGFAGSWWTGVVVSVRTERRGRRMEQRLTVLYDEILEEDDVTRLQEEVPALRVRPSCPDDSGRQSIAQRRPGDPVDCWHGDGWWEGFVHRVWDNRISVYFPLTGEEFADVEDPSTPPDPAAHRVRTGQDWDHAAGVWRPRPHAAYPGSADFRTAGAGGPSRHWDGGSSSSGGESEGKEPGPPPARNQQQPQQQPQPPPQQQQQQQKQQKQRPGSGAGKEQAQQVQRQAPQPALARDAGAKPTSEELEVVEIVSSDDAGGTASDSQGKRSARRPHLAGKQRRPAQTRQALFDSDSGSDNDDEPPLARPAAHGNEEAAALAGKGPAAGDSTGSEEEAPLIGRLLGSLALRPLGSKKQPPAPEGAQQVQQPSKQPPPAPEIAEQAQQPSKHATPRAAQAAKPAGKPALPAQPAAVKPPPKQESSKQKQKQKQKQQPADPFEQQQQPGQADKPSPETIARHGAFASLMVPPHGSVPHLRGAQTLDEAQDLRLRVEAAAAKPAAATAAAPSNAAAAAAPEAAAAAALEAAAPAAKATATAPRGPAAGTAPAAAAAAPPGSRRGSSEPPGDAGVQAAKADVADLLGSLYTGEAGEEEEGLRLAQAQPSPFPEGRSPAPAAQVTAPAAAPAGAAQVPALVGPPAEQAEPAAAARAAEAAPAPRAQAEVVAGAPSVGKQAAAAGGRSQQGSSEAKMAGTKGKQAAQAAKRQLQRQARQAAAEQAAQQQQAEQRVEGEQRLQDVQQPACVLQQQQPAGLEGLGTSRAAGEPAAATAPLPAAGKQAAATAPLPAAGKQASAAPSRRPATVPTAAAAPSKTRADAKHTERQPSDPQRQARRQASGGLDAVVGKKSSGLVVIPKRPPGSEGGGGNAAVGSPAGTPLASPRMHPKRDATAVSTHAEAPVRARQPAAKRARLAAEGPPPPAAHAAPAAPAGPAGPAAAPAEQGHAFETGQQAQQARVAHIPKRPAQHAQNAQQAQLGQEPVADPRFPTLFVLGNLPPCLTSAALRDMLERDLGVQGLESVQVMAVPLDTGDRCYGYAVLRFESRQDARRHYDALMAACLETPTCPVLRPLVFDVPRTSEGYSWGSEQRLPGHFPLSYRANQHFAQPNSIEFDLAIEWRRLLGVLRTAKAALCCEQAAEVARQLAAYCKDTGLPEPAVTPDRLLLPGEGAGPPSKGRRARGGATGGAAAGSSAGDASPESCCVWLTGVPTAVGEAQLVEAFSQFGHPQKAHVVLDPVTRNPSGHAVLWMESTQRARDLVQNLSEMVYMLNGTPRSVDASVARAGPPTGSQSVYDRALRCVFGKDDTQLTAGSLKLVQVPDSLLLEDGDALKPEQRAAILLRRQLRGHREEQADFAEEKRQRQRELDRRQWRHLSAEKLKLGRLAAIGLAAGPDNKNLLDQLLQQHGLRGIRVYGNKMAEELARWAAREQPQRLGPPGAAGGGRAPPRPAGRPH